MFNALFTKTEEYNKLAQALGSPGACALFGVPGAGRALIYAALARALGRPLCIVTPGEAEATRFAGDLNALGIAAAVFPARDYVLRPIEGTGREYATASMRSESESAITCRMGRMHTMTSRRRNTPLT